ncbi:alpha-amylase family protein [Sphingobium sp. Cam5-1]|uniref:alpha-amylase family protein n=1 Tax=Sphingobium sp. Cam5-1 TaxID=2789327 RepID=UPI0018AD2F01|nr:alpha-amylase family protein [Sphingobium sp. Cam5-1]QPI75162.1 beta-galactosidase trimerization domain-containing protein [Sphingobium sp. Cam5-1]
MPDILPIDRRTALTLGAGALLSGIEPAFARKIGQNGAPDWASEPMRWFQLAFTEDDPGRYDPAFWIEYFQQIHADGVCLSAGGGIAFYPTTIPYHGMAQGIGKGMDPFGDMVAACKKLGMRVLARIDPHAMNATAAAAHPEWALTGPDGKIKRHGSAPDLTLTCAYGPYNFDLMPKVIEEIAQRYPVDGFFGNRWNGSGTCYCQSCRTLYHAASGQEIPADPDPSKLEGRRYAAWVEDRLFALMDLWNAAARKHRPQAFFIPGGDRRGLVDLNGPALSKRLPLSFCDRQARSSDDSGWGTGPEVWGAGRYTRELRAFMKDKPVGHIISVGVEEAYRWKDSVQSPAEIRIWAAGAIAQGARPWITKFNAKPLDRRWMEVVRQIYSWHHANEAYLRNRGNLARVAIVHSPRTTAYLGGWNQRGQLEGHSRGFYEAALESRVPFDLIDEDFLDEASLSRFRTIILANAAVLSDAQCDQIRAFVKRGGNVIATYQTSLYDGDGQRRADFGLADLFGCSIAGESEGPLKNAYLTLRHAHPAMADLSDINRTIGPLFRQPVTARDQRDVALTLVPSYPDLPMERVFTDQTETNLPMAICRQVGRGRVAYLPMDIDRTFAELGHGDHLTLLHAMLDWTHQEAHPLQIEGPGLLDIACWRQEKSMTAHLVNLNNPMTMRGSYREAIRTGPYRVRMQLPQGRRAAQARLLTAGTAVPHGAADGWVEVDVPYIDFHEVVAIDLI